MNVTDLPESPPLGDYARIVGKETIDELESFAEKLSGVKLQEINSARLGGGVAEILISYVPFLNRLGIDTEWSVISGSPDFFEFTKTLHNFLQGRNGVSPKMIEVYWETTKKNADLIDDDRYVVTIHDPQPLGTIEYLTKEARERQRLIWRCHVQLETLSTDMVNDIGYMIRKLVEKNHASIFSSFQYLPLWSVPSFIVPPFIDPLSEKNRDLPAEEVRSTLEKYGVDPERPLVTQVSRYDIFKDPVGVIEAFRRVRSRQDCQLLLVGGRACDDPECYHVLRNVRSAAQEDPDIHILDLPPDSHREINAFQRASNVIVQKSVKEGFGLTVAEGLWKGRPVVAGNVGGIPLQVIDGWNGYLISTIQETADRILHLLRHPEKAESMGRQGKEYVRQNFLLTRGVKDHLSVVDQMVHGRIVSPESVICFHPRLFINQRCALEQ